MGPRDHSHLSPMAGHRSFRPHSLDRYLRSSIPPLGSRVLETLENLHGVRISSYLDVGAVLSGSHNMMKKENLTMCRKLYRQGGPRIKDLVFQNARNSQVEEFFLEGLPHKPRLSNLKEIAVLGHREDQWEPFIFDHSEIYIFNSPNVQQLHLKYVRAS
ncbi:hypothetical protein CPB83DRAFT_898704 [Crepidotus variabilis]|uniref:Uncharacterized protein n=1 Tax=Crepidotus variabilis TaxID=179855 RepID=A0A9P6E6K1_9AGAR|nr:hypothetical protein CPB83DRAFT_898704 [Crepidotus variabilis]